VIKLGLYDIAYGDSNGYVTVQMINNTDMKIQSKVHSSSVRDVYVDAVKCISCGNDGFVRVMDRLSGQVIFSYGSQGFAFLSLHVVNSLNSAIYTVSIDWKVHILPLEVKSPPAESKYVGPKSDQAPTTGIGHSTSSIASRLFRNK
jgi:hypothetical protein